MAFWGVEVKPGKTYTHPSSKTFGRLRLSQATLGFGESTKKSLVQCNVGKKSPVLLCCLLPDKSEYCHLELEFEEEEEVVFSVIGPRSVHLTGYYLISNHRHRGFDDSSESYGEDVGKSDTEKSTDEDEYDDSFINDGYVEVCPPSPAFSTEEMEEEIMDEKESHEKKGRRHRLIRMFQVSDSEDDGSIGQQGVASNVAVNLMDIEDEDYFPPSSVIRCGKTGEQKMAKDEAAKVAVDSDTEHNSNQIAEKSNEANVIVDADPKSEPCIQHSFVPTSLEDLQENEEELKAAKKKEKKRLRKAKALHPDSTGDHNICKDELQVDDTKEKCQEAANDRKLDADAPQSDERKPKRKRRKVKGNEDLASVEKQEMPSNDGTMKMKVEEPRSSSLKTFPNGLVVEELELGKADGEVASLGRKVKLHYTGKLKEGGHVYGTSIGSNPFKFRLGKGKTIEGLQLGLEGMRVGGRRRLMIPPELGYGSEGNGDSVPPNSWLKLDIELLNVR